MTSFLNTNNDLMITDLYKLLNLDMNRHTYFQVWWNSIYMFECTDKKIRQVWSTCFSSSLTLFSASSHLSSSSLSCTLQRYSNIYKWANYYSPITIKRELCVCVSPSQEHSHSLLVAYQAAEFSAISFSTKLLKGKTTYT